MNHGAAYDPILLAGYAYCRICTRVAYPTDAEWVSDELIIAAYPAVCGHVGPRMIILDPDQLSPVAGVIPAKHLPGRRCAGMNSRGRPCRALAAPGSDFCGTHRAGARKGHS